MNLQYLAKHQETILTEIRKNEAILLGREFMTVQDLEDLWEKQHKLTNVMMWMQNVAKSVQEQAEKESRIVKPTNGKISPFL